MAKAHGANWRVQGRSNCALANFPQRDYPQGMKPILRLAILVVVLAWSRLALCDEIQDAAKSGDLDKVKALLKANPDLIFSRGITNADPRLKDGTPLHIAALYGQKEVAKLLLANKTDVNAKDNYGATPLLWAALQGHEDVAELLLASNADVNAEWKDGMTPLNFAVSGGNKG